MTTDNPALTADDAARIAARYPRGSWLRRNRVWLTTLVALAFGAWVIWAGSHFAASDIAGRVAAVQIVDDFHSTVTLHVDRSDPSRQASCHVVAKSDDYQVVAELDVDVPPASANVVTVPVELKTVRTPASIEVASCALV